MLFRFLILDGSVYAIEQDDEGLEVAVWGFDERDKSWFRGTDSFASRLDWEGVELFETESDKPFETFIRKRP